MTKATLIRRTIPTDLPELSNCSALLQRIVASRGVVDDEALSTELKQLHPIGSLLGITDATDRLSEALKQQERILIVGDFDADGATATSLIVRALRGFGFQHVEYIVPNRFEYGYGLTPEIIDVASPHNPQLIITVDNGISSVEGVDYAASLGIDVIITDHHLPGRTAPAAVAIVNPNQHGDDFASKNLAGVGVVFYLMLAFKQVLSKTSYFADSGVTPPNIVQWLDLVALGTVADVVPLDTNNRILVEQGLRRIRSGHCSQGVLALLRIGKKNPQQVTSQDLGFVCGPRLNAAGRLDDMSLGIECLLTESADTAMDLAAELDEMNRTRRELESGMKEDALKQLDTIDLDRDQLPPIICLFHEEWHQGVVGIIAARIRERYFRPCIIFAPGTTGEIKGSGRSIPGIHMRDVIDRVATKHTGLVEKFGGHAMAAGLSLKNNDFAEFKDAVEAIVTEHTEPEVFQEEVLSDGSLETENYSLSTAEELAQRIPWGQGFPAPVFDDVFEIVERRVLKMVHLKLMLRAKGHSALLPAIVFNVDPEAWPQVGDKAHLLYQLAVNEYNGQRSLQLMVQRLLD
ncbi:single-stranded-DNA-specific exonuclease RecJ [Leucothrix arctica]|uniref:Single-stranded-DNA-specific exonuclease RecJ n=1 Tax=Leucothrix arctica TaxID=1481894 RepID=A0A317CGM5_9GAMM|nr:single-stranded-DNA-specific exonuclease RecJ [Leucothrix arctica]PWQ95372.1 single-stranded-DNA-specific exonuclease RecJ [Leucothrix arctica]